MMKMRGMPTLRNGNGCTPGKFPEERIQAITLLCSRAGGASTPRQHQDANRRLLRCRLRRRLLPPQSHQSGPRAMQTAFHRADRQNELGGDIRHLAFLPQYLHIAGRKLGKQGLTLLRQGEKSLPTLATRRQVGVGFQGVGHVCRISHGF
jgi:hypothetical protein